MNKLLSCEFNIDTGNVECRFADGTMISIDCDVVEDTIDGTLPFVRVRTELDWLIYNAPREYVQLVLNGGLNAYLKNSMFLYRRKHCLQLIVWRGKAYMVLAV